VRDGEVTFKGYELTDFEDAFKRYLGASAPGISRVYAPEPSHPSHASIDAGICDFSKRSQNPNVTPLNCAIANTDAGCDRVTALPPIAGMEREGARREI
jgi:hypothetical protein